MDNLIYASATEIARAIRKREVSSVEVVEAHLRRISDVNPRLNAVVQLTAETAMEQARLADAALARGEVRGPFHGVPMTIKDSFDAAGVVTTWGTPGRAHAIPDRDATIVARLKNAGAILLGKTNTPEFTLGHETDNSIYGRTNNPYNLQRSSGGSSGGAAAIVAAGGAPFDIGTDTGGSIRNPAHFCGLAGIKPTSGRVPRTGHAIPPGGLLDSLTQVGPLARKVEDLMPILSLIAGPDDHDPFISPVPLAGPKAVVLAGLKGTFHTDNGIQTPTLSIVAAVRQAVAALSTVGIEFEEKRPPGIEETIELMPALFRGWDGGAMVRLLLARAGTAENDSSLGTYLAAKTASPDELVHLIDRWDQFRMRMLAFFQGHDLIISPVNAYEAIPHGTIKELYPGFSYAMTYNLTGWPGATVRVGTSPEGLPIGVQIVAHPWREDVALAVAGYLEQAFGGWQPPPLASPSL
jgi:amidase